MTLGGHPGNPGLVQTPSGPDFEAAPAQLWNANYLIDGVTCGRRGPSAARRTKAIARSTGGGTDPQTYLTVSGSSGPFPPGTTVIAGPWQGGSQMQAWLMTPYAHKVT
jgi:hypothetical protein